MNDSVIIDTLEHEGMKLATLGKRGAAFFVDKIIISILFSFVISTSGVETMTIEQTIAYVNQFLAEYVAMELLYHTFFVGYYGATPAKMLFKLRVVGLEPLGAPSYASAFVRALVRVAGDFFFYINFLWAYFVPSRQTLQDKFAKTVVIDA